MGGFFFVLLRAGWHPGHADRRRTPLHHAYLQATTMTFLGIVACQIGTAFAARTDRASLRSVGVLTNRLLLWGIAFELVFAAAVVDLPPFQSASRHGRRTRQLALLLPFPVVVWGADELCRAGSWRGGAIEPRPELPQELGRRPIGPQDEVAPGGHLVERLPGPAQPRGDVRAGVRRPSSGCRRRAWGRTSASASGMRHSTCSRRSACGPSPARSASRAAAAPSVASSTTPRPASSSARARSPSSR